MRSYSTLILLCDYGSYSREKTEDNMKNPWNHLFALVSFGLIVNPPSTMAIVTTVIFGLLTFMPLIAEGYNFE